MISRSALVLVAIAAISSGCTDRGDDAQGEVSDQEGILDEGGLTPALLTLDDLGEDWIEPSVDPPHGSATHFFCMPTSVETEVEAGVSAGFDQLVHDPDVPQPPNIGQSILRYAEGADAAMDLAPVALNSCLSFSSLGLRAEQEQISLPEIGDDSYGVILESTMTFTVQEGSQPEREVDQDITSYAAFVQRGDVIALLMANEIEREEFERLLGLVDERLKELD